MEDIIEKVIALESKLSALRDKVDSEERNRTEWRDEVKAMLSAIDARIRMLEKMVWTAAGILAVLQLFTKKLL